MRNRSWRNPLTKETNSHPPTVGGGYQPPQGSTTQPQQQQPAPQQRPMPPVQNNAPAPQQRPMPPVQNNAPAPQQRPMPPAQNNAPAPQQGSTTQPQQQQPAPQQGTAPLHAEGYIRRKICNIHGRDKVIDFSDNLSVALVTDYAMIHGCGGKGHARNSAIEVMICDFSKKESGGSVTVRYNLDWTVVDLLLNKARSVAEYTLSGDPRITAGIPRFQYSMEKNNPYAEKNGYVPVFKLTVAYSPVDQQGATSRYPWYIRIDNFDAPIVRQENGATAHQSQKAINKRYAFINLSALDFHAAMVKVDHFIRTWEHHGLPVMGVAYRRMEALQREAAGK